MEGPGSLSRGNLDSESRIELDSLGYGTTVVGNLAFLVAIYSLMKEADFQFASDLALHLKESSSSHLHPEKDPHC